jgi:hypothetical protein
VRGTERATTKQQVIHPACRHHRLLDMACYLMQQAPAYLLSWSWRCPGSLDARIIHTQPTKSSIPRGASHSFIRAQSAWRSPLLSLILKGERGGAHSDSQPLRACRLASERAQRPRCCSAHERCQRGARDCDGRIAPWLSAPSLVAVSRWQRHVFGRHRRGGCCASA